MYGAFLYQENGDGYITPFLVGIYTSVDEFKKIIPKIVKEYSYDRFDEYWETRIVHNVHVGYPDEPLNQEIDGENSILSLEELVPNQEHNYKY